MIGFYTKLNTLTKEPNQYQAVVQPAGTIDYDGIIDQILVHHSTITRSDILAVLDSFFLVLINMLLLGFNVKTPWLNFRVTIRGNFAGQNDSFTLGRHRVGVSISSGQRLKRGMQAAQVQKQESSERLPHLLDYLDMNSGELNYHLTPGGMGQVSGHRLKFDLTDPNQGIFLVNGSTTRVEMTGRNSPSELIFLVPAALTPGEYSLEVRAAMSNGKIRTGVLPAVLTVG